MMFRLWLAERLMQLALRLLNTRESTLHVVFITERGLDVEGEHVATSMGYRVAFGGLVLEGGTGVEAARARTRVEQLAVQRPKGAMIEERARAEPQPMPQTLHS